MSLGWDEIALLAAQKLLATAVEMIYDGTEYEAQEKKVDEALEALQAYKDIRSQLRAKGQEDE